MRDDAVGREWLARAEEDLEAARVLDRSSLHALAAFHAQQAAEKALKALAIERGDGLLRTHDTERLARLVKAPDAITEAAAFLNVFYVGGRYPGVGAEVSVLDVERAIRAAAEVLAWSRTARS